MLRAMQIVARERPYMAGFRTHGDLRQRVNLSRPLQPMNMGDTFQTDATVGDTQACVTCCCLMFQFNAAAMKVDLMLNNLWFV